MRYIEREMYDRTEADHEGVTLMLEDSAGSEPGRRMLLRLTLVHRDHSLTTIPIPVILLR